MSSGKDFVEAGETDFVDGDIDKQPAPLSSGAPSAPWNMLKLEEGDYEDMTTGEGHLRGLLCLHRPGPWCVLSVGDFVTWKGADFQVSKVAFSRKQNGLEGSFEIVLDRNMTVEDRLDMQVPQ